MVTVGTVVKSTAAFEQINSSVVLAASNITAMSDEICSVDFGFNTSQSKVTSSRLQHLGLAYYIFIALYKR